MEDKQIIELYWNRSEDAIKETKKKYGTVCEYIVNQILPDGEIAKKCMEECYEILWENIPPRRPQNLKTYLYKITRAHALQMKEETDTSGAELITAEIVIHDFLNGLVEENRNLFIAHYWCFVSVTEEEEKRLNALYEQLNYELEQKCGQKLKKEVVLYAMTEIDDAYLENILVLPAKKLETSNEAKKCVKPQWLMAAVGCVLSIVILVVVIILWPKNPTIQLPTESDSATDLEISGTVNTEPSMNVELIYTQNGKAMTGDGFDEWLATLPWNTEKEIAALPIYKNLAYQSGVDATIYFDGETLREKAEEIAQKLGVDVLNADFAIAASSGTEHSYISGIRATTDKGTIEIDGNGEVLITFTDGIKVSDAGVLLGKYSNLLPVAESWKVSSYTEYTAELKENTKYHITGETNGGMEIVDYYFNQLIFTCNEESKLTSIQFCDVYAATELVGYYPLISYEEAKQQLPLSGDATVRGVELLYFPGASEEYYQPYYCFYVEQGNSGEYGVYYVLAVKDARVDGLPPESEVILLDVEDYEKLDDFVYWKEEKVYTLKDGEFVEYKDFDGSADPENSDEIIEKFSLDKVMEGISYEYINARTVEDKIFIICNLSNYKIKGYVYSPEDNSLKLTVEESDRYVENHNPNGIDFFSGRYALKYYFYGDISIVDVLTGNERAITVPQDDIKCVQKVGEQHLAFVYENGDIVIIECSLGQIVATTTLPGSFLPNDMMYDGDYLYIETYSGREFIFIISIGNEN